MSDPRSALPAASTEERRILRVMSVIGEPTGLARLHKTLDRLGWCDQDGAPLSRLVDDWFQQRLGHLGLVEKTAHGLVCHRDLLEPLVRETLADGTFQAIVAAAEEVAPTHRIQPGAVIDADRLFRMLRVALHSGQEQEALRLLGLSDNSSTLLLHPSRAEPLHRVLVGARADPAWLETLDPRLKIAGLIPHLRAAALDLTDQTDAYWLMERLLAPLVTSHPEVAEALAEQRLLRGRVTEVAPLLVGREDPAALTLLGWLAFAQGDYAAARETFEAARATIRRTTRKRKVSLTGLPGILALLALLQRGERGDLEQVQAQIGIGLRDPLSEPLRMAYLQLGDLTVVLAGQRRVDECQWLSRPLDVFDPHPILFQCLALHWLGEHPADPAIPALATWAARAQQGGWLWYAHEAGALLQAMADDQAPPPLAEPPTGLVPMTQLLARKSAWEIALAALQGLGSQSPEPAAPTAESQRRLVWYLSLNRYQTSFEPREQKRTRRGGWTLGRAISLQTLVEEQDRLGFLTAQDRAICACITRDQTSLHFGLDRLGYRLDLERALLAAVGHPLIMSHSVTADGLVETPVELVRGAPTLAVVRRTQDILVSIEPFPFEGRTLLPVKETPQRIRLVQFDSAHREIARILGPEGLKVPRDAEARLLQGLTAVAPMVTVHSDIGADEGVAETLPADGRPHLHLSPVGEGLSLDLYVHPFGERGPELRPGEGRAILLTEIEGRAVRCTRDLKGELQAAREVMMHCPVLGDSAHWSWTLADPELALTALEQLHRLGDRVVLTWPDGKRIALTDEIQPSRMAIRIAQQDEWLALHGELSLDDGRVLLMRELLDLSAASQGRFVKLGEHDYLILSQALRRRLDSLRVLTDEGRFHPLAAPAIAEAIDGLPLESDQSWRDLLERLARVEELEPALPSTLQAELRDYQIAGYHWLARLAHWGAGACLADDMGLGKTVQALALILARAAQGPTLVLAPTSVCGNWIDETQRFAPTLQPHRFGQGDRAALLEAAGPFDLIVCSHGLLQSEGERLAGVQWTTIVADEAQAFKNAQTKRSQALMRLQAGFRMITTGTPIENHLGELWTLFRFINPGLLGSLERFNQRFAIPIELDQDQGARQRLRRLLRPFILRRVKSEVLSELPPRTEITLRLELSEGELALYEAMRRQALERLADTDHPGQQRMQLLAEIMRLRRVCCHPRLALPESDLPSAKLEAFDEILDELLDNRHKALVFSQFVDHLALIRAHLDRRGIGYQYLDGATPEPRRRAAVAAFQSGEGDLFLISLRAGGVGLNLTAADYVIHMDPWWNPAVEEQASNRAHRIGQQRPVTVYRLVAKDTIEERILALHASKRDLAEALLEGSDASGRLSYAEMLELVRGE